MSNEKLFRTAGWGAFASALLNLGALVSYPLGLGFFGGVLETLGLLLLIFVFYALYVAHRSESKGLSLAGLVVSIVVIVVDVFVMITNGPAFLAKLWYLLISLPFLIFGYLAYQSAKLPRRLAVVALVAGVFLLISGVGGFIAGPDFADNVSLIGFLAMFVWQFWLWRVLSSKKFAEA
jgi:hypothetical protein